ncbi:MAG: hypothetical protein PF637_13710 [Spirochaetes bacterium]|jgi:hypothetical protein|nr:hypothetical protein [Spirochaetota bacterium]
MEDLHKKMLNKALGRDSIQQKQGGQSSVGELDQLVRQSVSDMYMALLESKTDPAQAIDLLAQHVAMMVEMINEFKKAK